MGEYDEYKESQDTSEDQSEQELWAVTWDMNSIEEDTDLAETSTEQSNHSQKDTDIDNQYRAAKNDIEFSKSDEERAYWTKRADDLWQQKEEKNNNNN